MRIHVLAENTTCRDDLAAEHGLSLLIEACGRRLLFDTGASGVFADNAARMGLDLSTVDAAVLSHGHYDHGGGLPHFLQLNTQAPVWVSPYAFEPHFNAAGKDIGLPPDLAQHPRLHTVPDTPVQPAPGITLFPAPDMPTPYPPGGIGMTTLRNGRRIEEDFRHEIYLLIEEQGKKILFSGCSHRGLLNIATHFRPDILIGGFHFMRSSPDDILAAAAVLHALPMRYYTGHCTGEAACALLQPILGERLQHLSTGRSFSI